MKSLSRNEYNELLLEMMREFPDDVIRAVEAFKSGRKRTIRSSKLLNYYINTRYDEGSITELTNEQKAELRERWGVLYDKNIIKDEWYSLYLDKTGKFNPCFIGSDFHYFYTEWMKINYDYIKGFCDKNYMDLVLNDVDFPKVLARKVSDFYLDANFRKIPESEVLNIIKNNAQKGVVIKISTGSSGGKGLLFVNPETENSDVKKFLDSSRNLVIQEAIVQHNEMSRMNESSVNTIRIMTMMIKGKPTVLSSIARIGNVNSKVDNFSSGGYSCGIKDDGTLQDVAYDSKGRCYTKHKNGFVFKTGFIPNFESIKAKTVDMHYHFPMFGVISWDIAIAENGDPIVIEYNVSQGQIDIHQYSNGPIYGEYIDYITDSIKKSYKVYNGDLFYNYYSNIKDEVVISKGGEADTVEIPELLDGKKVTAIANSAFYSNNFLEKLSIEANLERIGEWAFAYCNKIRTLNIFNNGRINEIQRSAFRGCICLEEINLNEGINQIHSKAFYGCKSLKSVVLPDSLEYIAEDAFSGCDSLVIKCGINTTGELYAQSHNIKYEII